MHTYIYTHVIYLHKYNTYISTRTHAYTHVHTQLKNLTGSEWLLPFVETSHIIGPNGSVTNVTSVFHWNTQW